MSANGPREEYRGSNQRRRGSVETILVINDYSRSQGTAQVRCILEPAGYGVIAAASGPNAIKVLRSRRPGIVVLNVCLPGRSGPDLCRQIRGESKDVPLLVLSAIRDVAAVVLLLELGADGYITEPFSPSEFLARIRAAMRYSKI
jgi:DNA-binding response OmpR family regulator